MATKKKFTQRERKAINKLLNANPAETSQGAQSAATQALNKAPKRPKLG